MIVGIRKERSRGKSGGGIWKRSATAPGTATADRYAVGERCWKKNSAKREKKKEKRKRIRILDLEQTERFKWFFCSLYGSVVRVCVCAVY